MSCVGIPDSNKGDIHLRPSTPIVNNFYITPENEETKIKTGFWGIALGLDFYHSKNQFLNLKASSAIDFFLPFPAAIDPSFVDGEEDEVFRSIYFTLSNNHRVKNFIFGYGLSYAINYWNYSYNNYSGTPDLPPSTYINKKYDSFGLIFPVYYFFNKYLGVGIEYRPSFFRPNLNDKFLYEHLISIELSTRIPFYNSNQKKFFKW